MVMTGTSRKRHYAEDDNLKRKVTHTSSLHKKARMLVTPQTTVHVSSSRKEYNPKDGFQHYEVANHGSEGLDEVEEEESEQPVEEMHSQELEDDSMPLVVFQCSTCRSIFGDSYGFVSSTEQLWLVTLSHVTNVALAPEVQTANTGVDTGSSYHEILCQNCQAVLGRKYLTTSVSLDGIRDLFSFSTEAITSYTLGEPMQKQGDDATADRSMQHAAAACHIDMMKLATDRNELARLHDEMEKVKVLMVTLHDRLAQLEGVEPELEEDTTQQQVVKVKA